MQRLIAILVLTAVPLGITLFSDELAAEDGPEIRAAKVCLGVGQSGWNAQGPLKIDNLSVQGDVSGNITVKRDGVDLGKIEKVTYENYTTCLSTVIKLLSAPSQPR